MLAFEFPRIRKGLKKILFLGPPGPSVLNPMEFSCMYKYFHAPRHFTPTITSSVINSSVRMHKPQNVGGKGQRQHNDTDTTRRVGKKNKTNNNDAVNIMNATTNDADAQTINAVRSTSGKQRVDADRTKVMVDNTINAMTNNVDAHTNNTVGPTSGKRSVDADETKVIADNTINIMTNNVDAHTNNAIKTATTDSDALSMMNTGTSDVVIEGTNNADILKKQMPHHTSTPAQGIKPT